MHTYVLVPVQGGGVVVGLDPLELELQVVVSHHMGIGNPIEVLFKGSKLSQLLSHVSVVQHRPHTPVGVCMGGVSRV